MSELRIKASEIKERDAWGALVVSMSCRTADNGNAQYLEFEGVDDWFLVPLDVEVTVERPEPQVTFQVTLTREECDEFTRCINYGSTCFAKVREAARAALEAQ